jgi:UDP-3-O-[3-hydroxymyristoyl] glucosamine N-acyltransferase
LHSAGASSASLTAAQVAELVGGALQGAADVVVSAVAPLDVATRTQLSFLADSRYASAAATTEAGVVLVTAALAPSVGHVPARVVVPAPHQALTVLLPQLYPVEAPAPGVHPTAVIGEHCALAPDAVIEAYAVLGAGCRVGAGSRIGPHSVLAPGVVVGAGCWLVSQVTCYAGTTLGDRVILHAGVRVGSDGFGYAFAGGAHQRIPHVGGCVIESDVEIGANSAIDRGSIGNTVIGAGSKLDNLVHVAHNVRMGRACLVMAQVGIAGSATIGNGVILAGQSGVAGHVCIGDGARIGAQSGALQDVPAGATYSGFPARPHQETLRGYGMVRRLTGLARELEALARERAGS